MAFLIYLVITGVAAFVWFNENKSKRLKEDNILDSWTHLFPDAQGKGDKVFKEISKAVEQLDPPSVILEEKEVEGGTIKEEKKRRMLVAENNRLAGFVMFVGAVDYGKQLLISWYLIEEITGVERFRRIVAMHWLSAIILLPYYFLALLIERVTKRVSAQNMGVFEQAELSAYTGTVHNAVICAAKTVAEELNLDFSKVDTKTRGFLNLS